MTTIKTKIKHHELETQNEISNEMYRSLKSFKGKNLIKSVIIDDTNINTEDMQAKTRDTIKSPKNNMNTVDTNTSLTDKMLNEYHIFQPAFKRNKSKNSSFAK